MVVGSASAGNRRHTGQRARGSSAGLLTLWRHGPRERLQGRVVATLFGQVTPRLPRFRCAACGGIEVRHLEVCVGNVETKSGGRQVIGAVDEAETDIKVLINRNLDAVGRTWETTVKQGHA
jgi:hypothetical protein